MDLIAVRPMTYATRRLAAGDLFTASARDARLLRALKRARLVEETEEPEPKPQPKPRRKSAKRSTATKD